MEGKRQGGRAKILLASPTRPFGRRYGDGFSTQANGAFQLTWAQAGFRSEDMMRHWGLDLIAANIDADTTVLHYPTLRRFVRELARGYDYVGLTCNLSTLHKIRPMAAAVRSHSPSSRIVLGGYGTILPTERIAVPADHICRGEGVTFMRSLLGQEDRPFVHPLVTIDRRILSAPSGEKTGIVLSSVGCPGGCDFCVTSHYHGVRKTCFLPRGEDVYRVLSWMRRVDRRITSFSIIDEDFLVDEARARELLECSRRGGRFHDIMVFASLRSLAAFTPRELVEMGISRIWIGFESRSASYPKLQGRDYRGTVEELSRHGISVAASMIVGCDGQGRREVEGDFRTLVEPRPTASQFMVFSPCYGTPAWHRLERQGRLLEDRLERYERHTGYTMLFRHEAFDPPEAEALTRSLYRREYTLLGPSLYRLLRVLRLGIEWGGGAASAVIAERTSRYGERLRRAMALYPAGILFAPSRDVRRALIRERREARLVAGRERPLVRIAALAAIVLYIVSRLRHAYGLLSQPRPAVLRYRAGAHAGDPAPAPAPPEAP